MSSSPGCGGIYISGGASPRVETCLITQNYTSSGSAYGAGIFISNDYEEDASPVIINCTISANIGYAGSYGGGRRHRSVHRRHQRIDWRARLQGERR